MTRILLILLLTPLSMKAQLYVDGFYSPSMGTVVSGGNGKFNLAGGGVNFNFFNPDQKAAFFIGVHYLSRGTGGRVGIIDQNGSFVRFVRNTENYNYAHIPLGVSLRYDIMFIHAGVAYDRLINYTSKYDNTVVSKTPQFDAPNLFGLHIEAGAYQRISDDLDLRAGLYFSNSFATAVAPSFVNIGLSIGLTIRFNEQDYPVEEDEY